MEELATFIEAREPGDFITAGINQTQLSGKCGFGDGEIRRIKENFPFATDKPGILIVDSDNLEELGIRTVRDYEEAIARLLGKTDYCTSPSASSGIVADGLSPQLKGVHTFCFVEDQIQIPETLDTLHKRSVLLGYGYPFVTKAGTTLIRSLVDTAMKTPNQPCYEGGALLSKGITQKRKINYWQHQDTPIFLKVIPISNQEDPQYRAKVEQLKTSVAEEAAAVRKAWLKKHEKNRHTTYSQNHRYLKQSGALYNTQVYTTFNMCITCVLYLKVRFCHLSTCVLHVYTTLLKMCTIVVYFSQ